MSRIRADKYTNREGTGAPAFTDGLVVGTGTSIKSPAANTLIFDTNSVERLRITSDGKIGIGTNNPNFKLVVAEQDTAVMIREGAGALAGMTTDTSQKLWFQGGNAEIGLFRSANGSYQYNIGTWQSVTDIPLVFRTGNRSERMRVTFGGNVGIGLTDPTAPLTVRNDSSAGGHTLLRLENLELNNSSRTECHIQMFLNNSNAAHTGVSIGATENSNDGYADLIFMTSPQTNSANLQERMRIGASGNCSIADGDLSFASGHGISFAATSDGSGTATSELLDDYEEGTWIPTLVAINSPSGALTYTTRECVYIKIGRLVHVQGNISWSNSTLGGSTVVLTGLPYIAEPGNNYRGGAAITYSTTPFTGLTVYQFALRTESNTDRLTLNISDATDGSINTQIAAANIANAGGFFFSASYVTT